MANGESDALDVLEREAKEYDKVSLIMIRHNSCSSTDSGDRKDAEIDRILKAFKLDA